MMRFSWNLLYRTLHINNTSSEYSAQRPDSRKPSRLSSANLSLHLRSQRLDFWHARLGQSPCISASSLVAVYITISSFETLKLGPRCMRDPFPNLSRSFLSASLVVVVIVAALTSSTSHSRQRYWRLADTLRSALGLFIWITCSSAKRPEPKSSEWKR